MKKTFKNAELLHIADCLPKLYESDTKFPVKVLWALRCNKQKIYEILSVYSEYEKEINQEYSGDDKSHLVGEGGENRAVKPEYMAEYQKKMLELQLQQSEIEISTIPFHLVEDLDMTNAVWDAVEFMIETDEA